MMKTSDMVVQVLIEAGIDYVFGIPGGQTLPIFDSLYDKQDDVKVILARHEQSAACMADMYGRLTRKPSVLMGQGAFICSNGGFGILEAYLSGSPMLVLTDTSDAGYFSQHGNYQSGSGEYGSFDIVNILRSMSKYTTLATTPVEAVHGTQLAIKHATTGRQGPACVVVRNDAFAGEIDVERSLGIRPTQGYLREPPKTIIPGEELAQVADLLTRTRKPVIIAGNGVHISGAYSELRELSEVLAAPVATSYKGKSALAEIHPMALGMMGSFGQKAANTAIADAELLLVAGCHLSPSDTKYESLKMINTSRQKIIQIDIDPRNAGWTFPVDISLIGDLKIILRQIIEALKARDFTGNKEWTKAVEEIKRRDDFFEAPELYSDASPVLPQRIVTEISRAVDPSAIITLDAGNNRIWMAHYFRSLKEGTVFVPGGIAGMGWGPAAALTAKLLFPQRAAISVVGDGGFAMVLHVLSTAVQYGLPAVFIVMNNSSLGMLYNVQKGRYIACDFAATDFACVAEGFGCRGVRVEQASALAPAIKAALGAAVPTVIDVITDKDESFLDINS